MYVNTHIYIAEKIIVKKQGHLGRQASTVFAKDDCYSSIFLLSIKLYNVFTKFSLKNPTSTFLGIALICRSLWGEVTLLKYEFVPGKCMECRVLIRSSFIPSLEFQIFLPMGLRCFQLSSVGICNSLIAILLKNDILCIAF